jgi:hypothetical protein
MKTAESALRTPPQPHKWSDKLRNGGLLRRCWKFRHGKDQHGLCFTETINKLEQAVQTHDSEFKFPQRDETLAIEEIRKNLNAATKVLTKCQDDAEGHCIQNQYDLLAKYESDKDPVTQEESKRKAKLVCCNSQGEET